MRRSVHPSRPSARIYCYLSSSKTLLMPATEPAFRARVNVSAALQLIAGFEVSINCRFWVSTEVGSVSYFRGLARLIQKGLNPYSTKLSCYFATAVPFREERRRRAPISCPMSDRSPQQRESPRGFVQATLGAI